MQQIHWLIVVHPDSCTSAVVLRFTWPSVAIGRDLVITVIKLALAPVQHVLERITSRGLGSRFLDDNMSVC